MTALLGLVDLVAFSKKPGAASARLGFPGRTDGRKEGRTEGNAIQPYGIDIPCWDAHHDVREEIDAFYGSIFGWSAVDAEVVGQMCHILMPDPTQFILLAESNKPMCSPGYDHLGLLQDTREEVDDLLEACERYATRMIVFRSSGTKILYIPVSQSTPSTSSTFCPSTSMCRAWSVRSHVALVAAQASRETHQRIPRSQT